jgi:hypothetical protein
MYAFLDSSDHSLSPKEKFDLFDEMLDKLTFFAKSLSQENATIAQLMVNCRNKISELKPIEQNSSEEPIPFSEKYISEQIDSVSHHLDDLFKTHQEQFTGIKSIPKSVLSSLEEDKERVLKIHDWINQDCSLSFEKQVSILELLKGQCDRMWQLIKAWSGKDDQGALNLRVMCNNLIMHLSRRKASSSSSSTSTPTPPSTPVPQTRKVRPTKPTPATYKIEFIFKTAAFGLICLGVAFLLYRRFRPLS